MCCMGAADCCACPYKKEYNDADESCVEISTKEALTYIQQLERENTDHKQFELLRAKTFEGIKKALAIDSHCKSYEGAFEVLCLYTDYFEDSQAIAKPEVVIRLHCYVLGPSRHYEWKGKTFAEALAKADYDITYWIKQLEVQDDG